MAFFRKYIRWIICGSSIAISVLVYWYWRVTIPEGALQAVRLNQTFGFLSVAYLYIALLYSPLAHSWPMMPQRGVYLRARRAIGVSSFYFALIHVYFAFFVSLGGFGGLGFLSDRFIRDFIFATIALVILAVLTLTSTDYWVQRLGAGWWHVHKLVYVAGMLVLLHTYEIGSHFITNSTFKMLFTAAIVILLVLQSFRLDSVLKRWFPALPNNIVSTLFVVTVIVLTVLDTFWGISPFARLSVHGH